MLPVACALILDPNGRLLCVRRSPAMPLPGKWEFPGGKVEAHETPAACVHREIREELALEVKVLRQGPTFYSRTPEGRVLALIPFACTVASGNLTLSEHDRAAWIAPAEWPALDWAAADIPIAMWWENCTKMQIPPHA